MFKDRVRPLLFGLIFAAAGWVVVFVFGQVSVLQCTRPEPSQVLCVKEVRFLGLVPMREEAIRDVQGAWIDESCDSDGCTYRVVLNSRQSGDVPLTVYYSSGWNSKEEAVTQINEYVAGGGPETLKIREGIGIFAALFGGIFMAVGAFMIIKRRGFGR